MDSTSRPDPDVERLLKHFGVAEAETPVVACGAMPRAAQSVEPRAWPTAIGIDRPLETAVYDLAVVGAGPERDSPRRSTAPPRACAPSSSRARAPGGQAGVTTVMR